MTRYFPLLISFQFVVQNEDSLISSWVNVYVYGSRRVKRILELANSMECVSDDCRSNMDKYLSSLTALMMLSLWSRTKEWGRNGNCTLYSSSKLDSLLFSFLFDFLGLTFVLSGDWLLCDSTGVWGVDSILCVLSFSFTSFFSAGSLLNALFVSTESFN